MTLELEIDEIYLQMLEQLEENAPGDPKADLARIVENEIHKSYQQSRSDE
jgi:hypothetical protein